MAIKGFTRLIWPFLLALCVRPASTQLPPRGCSCPGATVLTRLPAELPSTPCCLNFSGSSLGSVLHWPSLGNATDLRILDLSRCNISRIVVAGGNGTSWPSPSALTEVYLGHNFLSALPPDFLSGLTALRVLDLSGNELAELPDGFLRDSPELRELDLRGNRLRSLPATLGVRGRHGHRLLRRLELDDNPWDCSCAFAELLQVAGDDGGGNASGNGFPPQSLLGNATCASPGALAGRSVWRVRASEVCRPPPPGGLTALFLLLPLLLLSALALCWCCGRKRRRKEATPPPAFAPSNRKAGDGTGCNGRQQSPERSKSVGGGGGEEGGGGAGVLKNNMLLRPSSALLGSTRDIYEEVEIKLGGSVDSLPRGPSPCSSSTEGGGTGGPGGGRGSRKGAELEDAVSVTEVMKDSADREKAYLTHTTEYYSLVPGFELDDDSDHGGEYESVDLS